MNKNAKLAAITLLLAIASQIAATENKTLDGRIKTYSRVSTELSLLSNQDLDFLLEHAKPIHKGIGSSLSSIVIDRTVVAVKKITLTDLERKNFFSMDNLFKLPLFFPYGIGSAGLSAWRELAANIMTTNWVISGECQNFPVMYHWRILDSPKQEPLSMQELEKLDVQYLARMFCVVNYTIIT